MTYVLLAWTGGRYSIVKDHDDGYAWGSPLYTVVGFFKSYASAKAAKVIYKRCRGL